MLPIFNFLPLLIIIAIIAAIALVVRRRREGETSEPGLGTVRRLFYYIIAFVALMLAANGVAQLLDYALDSAWGPEVISRSEFQFALGLALTLVGTPLWMLFWVLVQRAVREYPSEVRSLTRKVYIYLVLLVSVSVGAMGLVSLLGWAFGTQGFDGSMIAQPVVWGTLFVFHWWTEDREGIHTDFTRSLRRLYVYLVSLATLAILSFAGGSLIERLLRSAYHSLFGAGDLLVRPAVWDIDMREMVSTLVVSGMVWGWHWFRVARGDAESVLRHVCLYVIAVLGGAIVAVASASMLLYGFLRWGIGGPGLGSAISHFDFVPAGLAPLIVGLALWGYHWAVLRTETQAFPDMMAAARRSYRYMMGAVGLGTLSTGLVFLFSLFIDLIAPQAREPLLAGDWWQTSLAVAITTLLVGVPLWWVYWFGAQRQAIAGGRVERDALSRRIFLFVTFIVAVLASVGGLSFVLFSVFQAALGEASTVDLLSNIKWGLGIVLTAGVVGLYYWLVLQEDRRALAAVEAGAPSRRRKRVVTLVPDGAQEVVARMEMRLGYRVDVWRRLEAPEGLPAVTDDDLAAVTARISEATGERVLVTLDAAGLHVTPYEER